MPINQVRAFETRLFETLERSGADFSRLFGEKKAMTDEVKAALEAILNKMKGKAA